MTEQSTFEDVTVERETSRGEEDRGALLCVIDGDKYWIPKKLIHEDSQVYKADTEGDLVVPLWFAEQEGLPF